MTPKQLVVRQFNAKAVLPPRNQPLFQYPEGFGRHTPLDIEIGCGVGWHPIVYAKNNPDRLLIAIEHTRDKFERFQSRLHRHKPLPNLIAIHADAVAWITHCLGPQQIDRCFILYPNPIPKAPNKRWLRMPFFRKLVEHMKPLGEMTLATNEVEYYKEALEYAASWNLNIYKNFLFTKNTPPQGGPRTHFEKKYLARGQTCYEIVMQSPLTKI